MWPNSLFEYSFIKNGIYEKKELICRKRQYFIISSEYS